MTNLYFQICGFFGLILIMFIYFSKQRVNSSETKIYSIMLIVTFIAVILDISIVFIAYIKDINSAGLILKILNKFYFSSILSWMILLKSYVFNITFLDKNGNIKEKYIKKMDLIIWVISALIIFILPVKLYSENNIMFSYGLSLNFMIIIIGFYLISTILVVGLNIRKNNQKKYMPIFILIILIIINIIINQINPGLLLTTPIMSYIVLIMYHTIENPDLKLINELNVACLTAQKANSAKTEFLSNMSHEIRTPLNAIVGFSQIVSEEKNIPDNLKDEVEGIVTASNSLLEIVNSILDISKIEANKIEIVNDIYNTKELFNELETLTKARIGSKKLDFNVEVDEAMPEYLYGDHIRIKQVVLNLLTNSVKYTQEGFVKLQVSSVMKDNICRLIISVEDSGIGIKEKDIDKLFTKFERLDEKNTTIEGTGLGLAITKKLVELMNGNIVVQSIFGKGSKFTVAIDQKVAEKKQEVIENLEVKDYSNKKILAVDDNKVNLKIVARFLEKYNIQVTTLESGAECLNILKNNNFDLILLDDMMPQMRGTEVLKKLKSDTTFKTPVVVLTANALSGMKEEYLNDGFDDYLAKPIIRKDLDNIINKFLN